MRQAIIACGGIVGLVIALGSNASAEEANEAGEGVWRRPLAAPSGALELKLSTAYTQGFGNVAPGRAIPDVAGAGLQLSADVDYRVTPRWSLGGEGGYQEFTREENASARGATANVGATYHFDPTRRVDPWLRLGTGYRLLWENDPRGGSAGTTLRHGFDVVTAKLGYDVRLSEDIALAPVLGADLDVFVWDHTGGAGDRALSSVQVGTFVYAGLQARFDLGGQRTGGEAARAPEAVTAPQPESPIAPAPPAEEPRRASPSLALSDELLRACEINLDAVDKAPKFEFDRSALLPGDRAVLEQVAACFTTGPMKGLGLRLVGRADPRGTVSYNDALGMRRASEVADYLEKLGVEGDRIERSSRGERDARGYDESSWAVDRRVDILEAR